MVWNGNPLAGLEAIRKFYTDLPSSKHTVSAFDAQPVFGTRCAVARLGCVGARPWDDAHACVAGRTLDAVAGERARAEGAQDMMMIVVHGLVVHGDKKQQQFTQVFMLVGTDTPQGKVHRVASDSFRFVGGDRS